MASIKSTIVMQELGFKISPRLKQQHSLGAQRVLECKRKAAASEEHPVTSQVLLGWKINCLWMDLGIFRNSLIRVVKVVRFRVFFTVICVIVILEMDYRDETDGEQTSLEKVGSRCLYLKRKRKTKRSWGGGKRRRLAGGEQINATDEDKDKRGSKKKKLLKFCKENALPLAASPCQVLHLHPAADHYKGIPRHAGKKTTV